MSDEGSFRAKVYEIVSKGPPWSSNDKAQEIVALVRSELTFLRGEVERLTEVDVKWQRWARDHVLCEQRETALRDLAIDLSIYCWHAQFCPCVALPCDDKTTACECGYAEKRDAVKRLKEAR